MHVLFSPAAPPHQLQGAPGMSPGLSQSPPADPSPSCQHPSLLSPPSCWVQGRDGAWTGASWALFSRTGTRSSRSCPALRAALGTASAPLTQCRDSPHPAWALWLVLTKHSPSSHIRSLCSRCLSCFHLRSSAAAKRASLEAYRTALAQRWHQGLGKGTWAGSTPAVILLLGRCDFS